MTCEGKETGEGRTLSRRYYHQGRMPAVFFIINGKSYTGLLTDISHRGLGIVTEWNLLARQGDEITVMYIGKTEKEYSIEGLRIAQIRNDYTTKDVHLGIFVPRDEMALRLDEIARQLAVEKPLEVSRDYNMERIPPFPGSKHFSEQAVKARLEWARGVTGARLEQISRSLLEPETLAGNIENYIGAVQIPLGIAGPLLVRGHYTSDYIPIPIATSEGALVSSITRGAKVCNHAGGVTVSVNRQRMLRAPVFFCEDMSGALNLEKWLLNNVARITEKADSVSSVGRLTEMIPFVFGETVHIRFYYNTGDAAGQNMTTACTWVACEWISEQIKNDKSIKFLKYNIEGNMSGDKKANYQNYIDGRGVGVVASCFVDGRLLQRALRISAKDYLRGWQAAEVGALQIGMMGSNVNFANVIAGIFTATGQDIASVHESSSGILKLREEGDGILFTAYLPALVIGTIGGGTKLPTQRECLELMGCYGQGKLFRFAEIIAATCLALDISTGAAIGANEFVSAHERLGRNRPSRKLSRSEIDTAFFTSLLHEGGEEATGFTQREMQSDSGIVSSMMRKKSGDLQGLFKYDIQLISGGAPREISAILKLKSSDSDIIGMGQGLARLSGEDRLPGLFDTHVDIFGFGGAHIREIEFYKNADPALLAYCPAVYGSLINREREVYALLIEDLTSCSHLETINNPELWDDTSVKAVLSGLAEIHAVYWEGIDRIPEKLLINRMDSEELVQSLDFLRELTQYNASRFPHLITAECLAIYRHFLQDMERHLNTIKAFPMTLTHNDFNPRNICLRTWGTGYRLVAYDWELPCYQNPQRDLIEFLLYSMPEGTPLEVYDGYIRYYREALQRRTGSGFDEDNFSQVLYLNALKFAVVRFNLYLLAHNIMKFDFMDRIYGNLRGFLIAKRSWME